MRRHIAWGKIPSQEVISFDGPLVIHTKEYDLQQAKEAAAHRRARKGNLALTDRTKGFNATVNGLWVPHSGVENTAVVSIPESYVRWNKQLIRDKVIEKYEDSDKSLKQIMLWAYFAGHQVGKELWQKFDAYIINAREGYLRIHAGLGPNGEVERERVEATQTAYFGVMDYLLNLQAFVGDAAVLGRESAVSGRRSATTAITPTVPIGRSITSRPYPIMSLLKR